MNDFAACVRLETQFPMHLNSIATHPGRQVSGSVHGMGWEYAAGVAVPIGPGVPGYGA